MLKPRSDYDPISEASVQSKSCVFVIVNEHCSDIDDVIARVQEVTLKATELFRAHKVRIQFMAGCQIIFIHNIKRAQVCAFYLPTLVKLCRPLNSEYFKGI